MCGLYAIVGQNGPINEKHLKLMAKHAQVRGVDSSGVAFQLDNGIHVKKRDCGSVSLLKRSSELVDSPFVVGHSRLVTNDLTANQPVIYRNTLCFHNGIITNYSDLWETIGEKPTSDLDSEIIPALFLSMTNEGSSDIDAAKKVLDSVEGVVSAIYILPARQKMILMSNNGSLYRGEQGSFVYISSEKFPLTTIGASNIEQIFGVQEIEYAFHNEIASIDDLIEKKRDFLLPKYLYESANEALLDKPAPNLRRCEKCVLPETMPFIEFDEYGVCNYCLNYKIKNQPKPVSVLEDLIEPYRRPGARDCIVPFSGGRDSSAALHLIVKELKMNPIAYTYDWGMVTDLGRRNISRMCAKLGVENIIVAADITKKRDNIKKNISAWLKQPHLGMISLWTAGDKHFFKYCEQVKQQTGISLNLWGVNPMETTHFKAGFLDIPPEFSNKHVYSNGISAQIEYQAKRYKQYLKNPAYFNSSIVDTISGEYWRSVHKKTDYFHIFDYWTWDEKQIDDLLHEYDWEWAADTPTSWRIGDGTAALYNYVYFTVAGFTEHDTFRSNQIREGAMEREEALSRVAMENQPRYESIQWYLDSIGLDFEAVIKTINKIPRLY